MSPALHTEAPPRLPGDSPCGKRAHDYGPGRVCSLPGCTTILRRTHKGPVCDPCQDNDHVAAPRRGAVAARRPHKPEIAGSSPAAATNHSGPPASAHGEAVTTAAPAVREQKGETVGKESLREAVLMVFARDPSRCVSPGDVVKSSGVSPSCVYKNLKALVASGEIVKDAPGVYRWPKIEDAKTTPAYKPSRVRLEQLMIATLESAPGAYFSARSLAREFGVEIEDIDATVARLLLNGEHVIRRVTAETIIDGGEYGMPLKPSLAPATPPAPAPVIPPPEQPANEAPAPDPLPAQVGLEPFAGIDYELVVIGEVVRRIESLTGHETRVRVAAYVASRFL